jgi:hypothetical protein
MPLIIDSHQDIAWNILTYGRDYTRSVNETRRLEAGTATPERNGDSIVGWPEYQRGQVAVVFATLFATPAKKREGHDTIWYADYEPHIGSTGTRSWSTADGRFAPGQIPPRCLHEGT